MSEGAVRLSKVYKNDFAVNFPSEKKISSRVYCQFNIAWRKTENGSELKMKLSMRFKTL